MGKFSAGQFMMLSQESKISEWLSKSAKCRATIVEERAVLRNAAARRAIEATQQLVSFCDAINLGIC
jgi:hypothetical protein